jgi:deoxyribonuclease IV
MSTLRVRQILEAMDSQKRAELKKLLPSKTALPELPAAKMPSGILSSLPKDNAYSILGCVAEEMLRLPSSDIDLDCLLTALHIHCSSFDATAEAKIRKSTTTKPFVDSLITTRKKLEAVLRPDGELKFEEEVTWGAVSGHPDMWNRTQVFEVKCSGELNNPLKKSALWTSFLFQVFAYGSLMKDVTDLYLVLPLQQEVIHYDIRKWENRVAFRDFLSNWSTNEQTTGVENNVMATMLIHTCGIGCHMHKEKSLADTVRGIADHSKPYQIFLSGPQNSNMSLKDTDLAAAYQLVQQTGQQMFVHSQYIINLCSTDKDGWAAKLLSKNLDGARAAGFKGVVVHVGKSTTQTKTDAMEKMRSNLKEALEHASVDCPLLLETPAGQGTELLTGREEFLDFVESFNDPRLRVCIDTCHVFACKNPTDPEGKGHDPLEYIKEAVKRNNLVKLIHFNDSLEACGACKDRHAFVGTGHIGFDKMQEIAEFCVEHNLPMVIE